MLKNTSTLNHYIQKNIPSQEKYSAMPRLAVHGDYHPGNLKFQGGKVIAVLDFGWSKIEARCFDVGLSIRYFCTSWEMGTNGNLQLDRLVSILGAYQEAGKEINTIGALTSTGAGMSSTDDPYGQSDRH